MSDAERLSDAMTKAAAIIAEQIGVRCDEHGAVVIPATINPEQVPLGGLRAARFGLEYLMVGIGVLDAVIAGYEPIAEDTDEGLRRLLGGAK